MRSLAPPVLAGIVSLVAFCAFAQPSPPAANEAISQPVPEAMPFYFPYGEPIRLAEARKALNKALAEADKHNWKLACAVVEPTGDLVAFEKMDDTQYGSIQVAQEKAATAARFRRSTKAFLDVLKSGNNSPLSFRNIVAAEGGLPILRGGKMVGAIGCSGGAGNQDAMAAKAGAD